MQRVHRLASHWEGRHVDIILIPGPWLDLALREKVIPVLEQTGHRTHLITLPGMESQDADLPAGHWPQITQPEELGRMILRSMAAHQ
jgi:hypothetical protein